MTKHLQELIQNVNNSNPVQALELKLFIEKKNVFVFIWY